jgi:hypothetical protein
MAKRKAKSQIGSLTPDHKMSRINPISMRVGGVRHTVESSRRKLQLCFKSHPDSRSKNEVIALQSYESSSLGSFGTPLWASQDKKPFGCSPCGEVQSILYGGRWWLPPSPSRGESCESKVACGLS